jgi:hypothetical protein
MGCDEPATAAECLDIADVWATETPNLGLSENKSKSKLGFSAVGTKANTEELAMELQAREIHNPPETRPKILGTRLILNRRHAGAGQEETKALTKALTLTTWIRALPYSLEEKIYFYKATAVAVVAASRYVRLFSQDNLNPIRRAMSDLDHNGHHRLGHVGPLYVSFRDMLPILTLGWVAVLLCKHYLKPVPKILHNGILARPKAHSFC